MQLFRRKTRQVQAKRWFPGDTELSCVVEKRYQPGVYISKEKIEKIVYMMDTVNGKVFVEPGDWIVIDEDGNYRVMRASEFDRKFEAVE